jgi:hypothetical protein
MMSRHRKPINESVETAANIDHHTQMQTPDRLLRHYLALAELGRDRLPARERLEQELGPELTQKLLESLSAPADER